MDRLVRTPTTQGRLSSPGAGGRHTGVYTRDGDLDGVLRVCTNINVALRPLLERSWDAAVVLGADAVVRYASPAVEHLLGWTEADLVGADFVPFLHEDDRAVLLEGFEALLDGDGPHAPVELRFRGGQGWLWCEVAVTNLLDDPALRGVVCHLRPGRQRAAHEHAEQRAAQLQTALSSRLVIERAKGYLAGRHDLDPEVAFELLRDHARSHPPAARRVPGRAPRPTADLEQSIAQPSGRPRPTVTACPPRGHDRGGLRVSQRS